MVRGSEDGSVINKDRSPSKSVEVNENSNNITELMERGGGGSGGAQTNESSAKRKSTAANEGPAKKQKR